MKLKQPAVLIPTLLLAACGGEEQTMKEPTPPASVVYSYPADGQTGVSPSSDIILRFSHSLADSEEELKDKILVSQGENPVDFTATRLDQGRSLKITPTNGLETRAHYSVEFTDSLAALGASAISTPNAVGAEGVQFSTRGEYTGIASLDHMGERFAVEQMIPSPGHHFQPMDFSTFRLMLSQPVHPDWRNQGGKIRLQDANGEPVPTNVLVDNNRIVIDPCMTDTISHCGTKKDELASDQSYTLTIQNLPNLAGTDVLNFNETFTPRESGPTVVLLQHLVDSGLQEGASHADARKSVLNGQVINGVTLNSVLLGNAGPAQQAGGLFAELAYAPSFAADEALPLRIPRGSLLTGTNLDVRINGQVQVVNAETGVDQNTGELSVTMLTDASGYLSPNPYTDDLNAPRHVTLFMDVAMHSAEAQPNASLSQNLLGVELHGIAIVQDGVLTIDAIGTVEPELLGQEYANATIAFRIEAATDVDSALDAEELWRPDNTSPTLISWMPGAEDSLPAGRQSMQRPGDPVILNFDEPLDPASLDSGITLFANGAPVPDLSIKLDGTVVVINPEGGLKHGAAYELSTDGLTDMAGNPVTEAPLSFTLDDIGTGNSGVTQRSPLALTTYPGYPCVTHNLDLANGSHGFCNDAVSQSGGSLNYPDGQSPDELPVTELPADRPITVVFSQSMDLASIHAGTFVVEQVSGDLISSSPVAGRLEKSNQRIRFFPDQPWQEGQLYRYTLASQQNGQCATNGSEPSFICGDNGLALQTDLLVNPVDVGGPDLSIYFRGTATTDTVFTALRNLPVRDTNSNYEIDCGALGGQNCLEPFSHTGDGQGGYLPSANATKLIVNPDREPSVLGSSKSEARVGCRTSGADCPTNKFIYQTYGLNTEIIGPAVDPETGKPGVRVYLYPTLLATTSVDVFLEDGNGLTDVLLDPDDPQVTGPQILRMRYAKDDPSCTEEPCRRSGLIPGMIIENDEGKPTFKASAALTLDAPELHLPLGGILRHNLFSYPFTLNIEGPITFFDDGRMQIEQRNIVDPDRGFDAPQINVLVTTESDALNATLDFGSCLLGLLSFDLGGCQDLLDPPASDEDGAVFIPLMIPDGGLYLNFISNPVHELPATP
ncbi:Ig-like domain-containing protein [Marinobacter sp. chi1]|uniref:Ig-like domain-containing protein n=1 Tax=Marinobacter suaedae TaxID=3057675 RepID=A0ABT8W0N5_9GAMM|nr:Ig-like domain-containing protein [Marinobacter sp. chi1]MDO3721777.1 Ig-like domain-containing protein [Marinobacter sp. chi1]